MLTLIIGGSGSGKSEYAENYLQNISRCPRIYIATMQPSGSECLQRIQRHRAMRAEKSFFTIECYTHLEDLKINKSISAENASDSCQVDIKYDILLECMSNLMANELYAPDGRPGYAADVIAAGIKNLETQAEHLVIVSSDVFSDGDCYDASTLAYMRQLGEIHMRLASEADEVIEVTAGCPVFYKHRARQL